MHSLAPARHRNFAALKTVAAVLAALLSWIVVATAVNLLLRVAWPGYHEAETTFQFTLGMKLARLALGALSSACAGFVAASVAKGRTLAAKVTGIILLALFIPNHYALWDKFPVWYHLTFLISIFPLTLLGAALRARDPGAGN